MPASIPPPPPPSGLKQQCVAGLQVASQGACAWSSFNFMSADAGSQSGMLPPPELLEEELELELLDVEPEELELLEELEPASVGPGFEGGGSVELDSFSVGSPAPSAPGISEADSAQAETTRTEATRPVATRA